jgi:multifunctional 2-oxoglutarate metabolism enzyme
VENDDGSRSLLVPVIQDADTLSFEEFLRAYEEVIRKIRTGKLDPAMFAGATITITNPGTIGTVHSIPRLMAGPVGDPRGRAIDYPPSTRPPTRAPRQARRRQGHHADLDLRPPGDPGRRVGMYLKRVHELLLGEDGFYDEVFASSGCPTSRPAGAPTRPRSTTRPTCSPSR